MKSKNRESQGSCYYVLPQYGKKKLISYAESLTDLAENYSNVIMDETMRDRQEVLLAQKLFENRTIMSKQLKELSVILTNLANEAYYTSVEMDKQKNKIYKILTDNGLHISDIYVVENRNGFMEIGITMKSQYGDCYDAKDIAKFLSKLCHSRMVPAQEDLPYITEEETTILFKEAVHYRVMTGVAKAIKAGESYSGDNYSLREYDCGSFVAALSDGMGSGAKANHDSEIVVELLEKFLEAGFSIEIATEMVNDLFLSQVEELRTVTLDILELNLYTGIGRFTKVGAAASFVKRGSAVDKIACKSLPLGLFAGMGYLGEEDEIHFEVEFEAGDFIIIVSDGVLESLSGINGEGVLKRAVSEMDIENPKEMANMILGMAIKRGNGHIKDDMTVLVLRMLQF